MIDEALARGHSRIDVLIVDEIKSGSGVNRILKLLEAATARIATDLPAARLSINFVFYIAAIEGANFEEESFIATLDANDRRLYQCGGLTVYNRFTLFRGPLLTYDAEDFSGLRVLSEGADEVESYGCIKFTVPSVEITCPNTGRSVYTCSPGSNDFPTFLGVTILEWLGQIGSDISYEHLGERIMRDGCEECRAAYAKLRSESQPWTAVDLRP
jgi:hypothetical protein